jgi:threonine dehydrogenase-like Zn-dependent dehydrogenase
VETVPVPEPGPGEVLLKLGAGGICGSDLHYFLHGRIGSFLIREPLVPGHEISGSVAKVGVGVTRVRDGDKVAINPSHACGTCRACRAGRENLCSSMRFLGSASVFPHVQGMFREYFLMGERQCYPIVSAVTLSELAFAEPLAVSLHAVHRAGNMLGKSVLVTGAGPIGCLIVMAARLAGAARVVVTWWIERLGWRRPSVRIGACARINSRRTRERWPKRWATRMSRSRCQAVPRRWRPAWRAWCEAGVSSRWGRSRRTACNSRPTRSWSARSTTSAPSASVWSSTGRCGI